jgi:hypothetical protein
MDGPYPMGQTALGWKLLIRLLASMGVNSRYGTQARRAENLAQHQKLFADTHANAIYPV